MSHLVDTMGYSLTQLVAIARGDYFRPGGKKRFQIALYEPLVPDPACPSRLYGMRVSSGHSIKWLTFTDIMCPLSPADADKLPAMCHGTYWQHIPSILRTGLRAGGPRERGRAHVMFSMFPHFDPRQQSGQRHNQWDTLIFIDPGRYARQTPYYNDGDRRDDNILLAQAGSLNVRGPVSINYIDKIVVNARETPFVTVTRTRSQPALPLSRSC